ncbi:sugar ABC transporter permease [Acuticoccus sp. MNP-M23]|uniref:carbohydrate ABC transporter permease n=1 Tax=Acuticoccus sp. MNP-M23 TaxID=3072793 RepID=UPI002815CE1F|nr:sugar ABC transporter permease [Acuticoccus sp. MNP-M23]WMS42927.1 sugar ABC transporter permease [Acuticoccus sp. MNP-M23]
MSSVTDAAPVPPARKRRRLPYAAAIALAPTTLIVLVVYVGCMLWTVRLSFTSSRLLPKLDWVGFSQYERLVSSSRFLVSVENIAIFGVLYIAGCLVLGFLMAVFIDQKVRNEAVFRTIFLYPYSMSFVVTGLVWQWIFNPTLGLQNAVHKLGFGWFKFDWVVDRNMVVYAIVLAAIWQGAGLVMAILLAGLRGIDEDLWKAARVDGIPPWRMYLSVILPLLGPMIVTAVVLLATGVARLYDLVVAMSGGGPGIASEVPAKFVMDHLFERANIGLATSAATLMLITVAIILAPWMYARYIRDGGRR